MRRAIGAGYLLQQAPGAEMLGGLEVVLRSPGSVPGGIRVTNTLWQSENTREDIDEYQSQALAGLKAYAEEHNVDLTQFDVELCRFVVHDVDSMPKLYFLAAQNALECALNMWNRKPPH